MRSFILKHHQQRKEYSNEFVDVFGISLETYWTPLYGFDVVKFDDEFLIPKFNYEDNKTSMRDCIQREYGNRAVEILKNLI